MNSSNHRRGFIEMICKRRMAKIPTMALIVWSLGIGASSPALSQTEPEHPALPLRVLNEAPLSGGATRWDYASLDIKHHHLFLAHLGNDAVVVFDTQKNKVIATIPGVDQAHGVLYIPELNRVYASATGTDHVVAINAKTFKITARISVGHHPDGMAYAPNAHRLFVSDELGGTDTVINTTTNQRIDTIPLGGEVGNTQYDPVSQHIFANVQTLGQLVEIDPKSDRVIRRIPLPGAVRNHGLLIDASARLAFIACEGNNKLLVLDLKNHTVLASFDVAKHPDVLAFDASLGWLYVAGESGQVSIYQVRGQKVTPLATAWLGPNAHVVAVDPQTHKAYFPLKPGSGSPTLLTTMPVVVAPAHH